MIQLALAGEIDLIVTKEVSRFARNTVDTLQVTRQLKEKGVGVLFLNDNIDTRDNDGEFRLTIMASVAQEESRKISDRTRWGQTQAMKRGVAFGNNSIYGYTLRHGRLTVDPDQAEVVRLVYRKFLAECKGTYTIARELTESGIRPPLRPVGAWTSSMILKMLRNEKYCGDLLQKKYCTTDHLSHRKILNEGTEEKILLRDHHEPIVSREEFTAVQEELTRRAGTAADGGRFSARYWFSGKIRCGACGGSFTVKRTPRAGGREYQRFVCRGHYDPAVRCQMHAVRGEVLYACARYVLRELALDNERIVSEVLRERRELRQVRSQDVEGIRRIQAAIRRQMNRKDRAQEAFLDGALSCTDMQRLTARCEEEMARLRGELERVSCQQTALPREAGLEEIQGLLERELAGGENVLDEVIREITVYDGYFVVEAAEIPVRFRVRAEGRGAGKDFEAAVVECVPVPGGGGGMSCEGG